ncbi:MAG: succinyldiaminopimelate transaminase [bacterium]|nr:succinyldiaminopimelate transaminase [bacterium]
MNERLANQPPYPMVRLEEWRQEIAERGVQLYDFGTGDPREPTPALLRQAMIDAVPEVSQYPASVGVPALREAAAGYLQRRFGVEIDPATEVLPTFGSKEAIFHLPMTFVQIPGDGAASAKDTVVYGEPAYPVYEIGALFAGAKTHAVTLGVDNGYAMDPDGLPDSLLQRAAIVYLNYPHNPTGFLLAPKMYEKWVTARERFGFVLVSDECYVDLHYEGDAPRSLLEFGREGCLVLHSLSKRSGMTGYRSGFLAGDAKLVSTYRRFRASMGTTPQEFVQAAAAVAWTDTEHVEARRAVFVKKREVLLAALVERGLRVHGSTAGLYLWVEVPDDTTDTDYAARLREVGILVAPGSFFGEGQERFVRLALVPTVEECREVAAAWPRR